MTKRDVEAISVLHQDQRPTRWGTEILVEKDGQLLRLLSIHLKSGCHAGSLEPPSSPDCVTLAAQRAPLEEWIDAAADGEVPFIIAGDWNRRIGVHGQNDHIWGEIDDGEPAGLNLWRLPFNRDSECNAGFTKPIDFVVSDDRAWQLVDEASFQEVVFDDADWDPGRRTPSDHCPIVVTLDGPTGRHRRWWSSSIRRRRDGPRRLLPRCRGTTPRRRAPSAFHDRRRPAAGNDHGAGEPRRRARAGAGCRAMAGRSSLGRDTVLGGGPRDALPLMGRKGWRGVLQADKGEFEAATGNIALKASAKRYMRAGTELKPGGKV